MTEIEIKPDCRKCEEGHQTSVRGQQKAVKRRPTKIADKATIGLVGR